MIKRANNIATDTAVNGRVVLAANHSGKQKYRPFTDGTLPYRGRDNRP